MITYIKDTGLSYAIAILAIAALFCIPKIRRSPHTTLWRVFFPVFVVFHLSVTWWLLGVWFDVDGASPLDSVVHAWCCFTHLFNIIVNGTVTFFRWNLEFHIPFALGSVSWSAVLTLIIVRVSTKLVKSREKRHPNKALEATP